MSKFAKVFWTAEDVLTLRPDWTMEEAENLLSSSEKQIEEGMIERGWHVLEDSILKWEEQ